MWAFPDSRGVGPVAMAERFKLVSGLRMPECSINLGHRTGLFLAPAPKSNTALWPL